MKPILAAKHIPLGEHKSKTQCEVSGIVVLARHRREQNFLDGITDGSEIQAEVLLRSEDGGEISVMVPDRELYDKDINEGDWVHFDVDGNIIKE